MSGCNTGDNMSGFELVEAEAQGRFWIIVGKQITKKKLKEEDNNKQISAAFITPSEAEKILICEWVSDPEPYYILFIRLLSHNYTITHFIYQKIIYIYMKLRYKIASFSSQDANAPISNLITSN